MHISHSLILVLLALGVKAQVGTSCNYGFDDEWCNSKASGSCCAKTTGVKNGVSQISSTCQQPSTFMSIVEDAVKNGGWSQINMDCSTYPGLECKKGVETLSKTMKQDS